MAAVFDFTHEYVPAATPILLQKVSEVAVNAACRVPGRRVQHLLDAVLNRVLPCLGFSDARRDGTLTVQWLLTDGNSWGIMELNIRSQPPVRPAPPCRAFALLTGALQRIVAALMSQIRHP